MDTVKLTSPDQLPDIEGENLVLVWDQEEWDSLILFGNQVLWREHTGFEVYDRFEEIAAILKQRYGDRIVDLVPTGRSEYALYGDRYVAYGHVREARRLLGLSGSPEEETS